MGNVFQSVSVRKPSSNTFDLGHDVKYTMQMGTLTPVLLQEVLPGDTFKIRTETLIRFAPLVAPVMHRINVFTHYFFVPNRLVWSNWEDFISPDLSKDTPPAWPFLRAGRATTNTRPGTLWDYFGLPAGDPAGAGSFPDVSAIPFAAYQLIWKEYYRDQNLQLVNDSDFELVNGSNSAIFSQLTTLRRRAWMHDYFTAALPFAQKGPAVNIPLEFEDIPVRRNNGTGNFQFYDTSDDQTGQIENTPYSLDHNVPQTGLYVPTSDLDGAASINNLRMAIRMQEFFEKAARGGTRYIEQLKVHFNVNSSDARLNRPEFLGGMKNPVIISEVLQTSSSDDVTPQATMAGHGISANSGKSVRYYAEEHGYIIGIQSIMPVTAYQDGVPKHFMRQSWEDYAWPTFAHLGEQEVKNVELYDANDGLNEDTFGYVPRFSEYRFSLSRVAGEFRHSLAFWHLGRIFTSRPALNSTFIECNPRTDIFAVSEEANQNLWCHSYNKVFVRRKLPKFGTPTL